jgi:ornithine carbamoyltransferase
MDAAFEGADIVYPKSWAPYEVMQKRVPLLHAGDQAGLKELEKACLANNARFKDWECTEARMKLTAGAAATAAKALYMHCLPADITDVSCAAGEVAASVFDRYRDDTYREASYKPYIIAAMILLGKSKDPAASLARLLKRGSPRSYI